MNHGVLLGLLLVFSGSIVAANTPCSGMKGGISHCEGRFFICNDGSHSASKKDCSAEGYGGKKAAPAQGGGQADAATDQEEGSSSKPKRTRSKH